MRTLYRAECDSGSAQNDPFCALQGIDLGVFAASTLTAPNPTGEWVRAGTLRQIEGFLP